MKNNRVRVIPFIVQFKFFLSEKSVAKFVFTPGTNKFKATAKSDLFVVSSVSSPGTDADTIINYKSKDRIDLPGDWTKRNGKPRIIRAC